MLLSHINLYLTFPAFAQTPEYIIPQISIDFMVNGLEPFKEWWGGNIIEFVAISNLVGCGVPLVGCGVPLGYLSYILTQA